MKNALFFLYVLVIGFILVGVYSKFFVPVGNTPAAIKIPFIGSQFSLENAPSESLKGKITSMTGSVLWMDRVATESSKLAGTEIIQQGEQISTSDNGNIVIQFNESVEIDISPKTQIDIVQTLPNGLVFSQASGSAVFKKQSKLPVSIRVFHLLIENGGVVSVSVDKNIMTTTITANLGDSTVAFNDLDNTSNVIKVPQGKKFIFADDTRQGEIK